MAQNTISDELSRLIQAKADLKTALQSKGVTIGDSSTLDEFPGLIEDMPSGGGGSDTSTLIDWIEGDASTFEIPYGTTKIRQYAFNNDSSLVDVTIPNTVTRIGKWAFSYSNLSNLNTLPSSVTSIPDYCFYSTGLMKFIISNTVAYIGNQSFANCGNLATVIIPASVTSMGLNCFQSCSNLNDIVLLHNSKVPYTQGSGSLHGNTMGPIYVLNSMLSSFQNNNSFNQYLKSRFTPLASATYDASTYTVTASGRDTLELYIDASLCDSSVYTFTPGTADASHNIMVKSVDPSLGVLDTYNLEVLIPAESGGEDPGGDKTQNYTLTPKFVEDTKDDGSAYSGYIIQQVIEAPNDNYYSGVVSGNYDFNNLSQNGDYAIVLDIVIYPPYGDGGDDAGVITPVRITLYEAPSGTMSVINDYSTTGTLTQDQNNPLVYTYTVTNDQKAQQAHIQCISNNDPVLFKVAKIEFNYTQYE